MKKLLLTVAIAASGLAVSAQHFEFGGFGMLNSPWILNQNVIDDGEEQDFDLPWKINYGINGNVYFAKNFGVGIEFAKGSIAQNWTGTVGNVTYTSKAHMNALDIPVLLKLGSKAYFEIGPQYSILSGHTYEYATDSISLSWNTDTMWAKSNFSLVLGMGANIELSEKIWLTAGLRFNYGLTDLKGHDALGRDLSKDYLYEDPDPNDNTVEAIYKSGYQKSYTAQAGFKLGLMYRIGGSE